MLINEEVGASKKWESRIFGKRKKLKKGKSKISNGLGFTIEARTMGLCLPLIGGLFSTFMAVLKKRGPCDPLFPTIYNHKTNTQKL